LRCGGGERAIALRADMDALPIREKTGCAHASTNDGVMHACGHDGPRRWLLGAARYLAETRNFDGTVHFVFPARRGERMRWAGDGRGRLVHPLPSRAVYGMHNWPGVPVGAFAVRSGPIMAADDKFEITISSRGAHAAMPQLGDDPIVAAGALIGAIQTIASRTVDPQEEVVVSLTQVHGGNTWNVIRKRLCYAAPVVYFKFGLRQVLETALRRISEGVAATHGVKVAFAYRKPIPPAVKRRAADRGRRPGRRASRGQKLTSTAISRRAWGCEDFAFMLAARPGCYIWIGNGPTADGLSLAQCALRFQRRNPALGASYWCTLVESILPRRSSLPPVPGS